MRNFYKTLEVYRYSDGDFTGDGGYSLLKTIKGIIQVPSSSKNFNNGKDGESVDGILFCDIGNSFQPKDKIKVQGADQMYFISGYNSQSLGVTGIKAHHAEYKLTYDGVA